MHIVKRLWRIVWSGMAGVSALLCLATAALWARSYWAVDQVIFISAPKRYVINTGEGQFALQITESPTFATVPQGWRWNIWNRGGLAQQSAWNQSMLTRKSARRAIGFGWIRMS